MDAMEVDDTTTMGDAIAIVDCDDSMLFLGGGGSGKFL